MSLKAVSTLSILVEEGLADVDAFWIRCQDREMYARVFMCHRESVSLTSLDSISFVRFSHSGAVPSIASSLVLCRLVPCLPQHLRNPPPHLIHVASYARSMLSTTSAPFIQSANRIDGLSRT